MNMQILKNIPKEEVFQIGEQVTVTKGQVVSKTFIQNDAISMTAFAFDEGEEISTHESSGDALVTVLEGTGKLTVDGNVYLLQTGESLVMPAHKPHAVYGETAFKMLLTVVFDK